MIICVCHKILLWRKVDGELGRSQVATKRLRYYDKGLKWGHGSNYGEERTECAYI